MTTVSQLCPIVDGHEEYGTVGYGATRDLAVENLMNELREQREEDV
jgi:hypothetical protein